MTTLRTIRVLGKAYSEFGNVHLDVKFNNKQVFKGDVTTHSGIVPEEPRDMEELFEFEFPVEEVGLFPLEIKCSNGELVFGDLSSNYVGYEAEYEDFSPIPDSYRALKVVDGKYVIKTKPKNYWGPLHIPTIESDGKDNVTITPDCNPPQKREVMSEEEAGAWLYKIWNGSQFNCDIRISRSELGKVGPAGWIHDELPSF